MAGANDGNDAYDISYADDGDHLLHLWLSSEDFARVWRKKIVEKIPNIWTGLRKKTFKEFRVWN